MSEAPRRVPRLKEGADPTQLPLGPTGGFVLSRIDGRTSVEDLSASTGVPAEEVARVLRVLDEGGVLAWADVEDKKPRRRTAKAASGSRKSGARPLRTDSVRTMPVPPGTPRRLYDPQELNEEGVELEVDTRRSILDTYYRLSSSTLYQLLGVPTDAPKAEIRSAYFRLSKVFHPDTRYGKELGSYKSKMEAVFKRLTEAYEILGKKKRRKEYDEYLNIKTQSSDAEKSIEKVDREAQRLERESMAAEAADEASKPSPRTNESTRPPTRDPRPPETPLSSAEGSGPRTEILPSDGPSRSMSAEAKARAKRLMAKKLGGERRKSQRPGPVSGAPSGSPQDRGQVLRGLTSSLKQAATHTGGFDRSAVQLEQAREAEQAGNLLAAVNALRLALAMAGERPDIVAEYDRVRGLYAAEMAETFEKQARYEARLEQWTEAALSWSKVCEGRPDDGEAHLQAAMALVEGGGDATQAKRFAERARTLGAEEQMLLRTLGRVYYALDMKVNAKTAFQGYLKLAPDDQEIKKLLKDL